jgi:chromosome partitioning protein
MTTVPAASLQLKNSLRPLEGSYDYVIIDCPPSLGILTLNALRASSKLIIPMQCEYYAMEGLVSLNKAINDINTKTGENIQISAILRTMFDPRARLTREVSEELQKYFPNELCSTVIPRNIKLAEAPSAGKPGLFYDPKAKGAVAYLALAGEVISKFEKDSMVA